MGILSFFLLVAPAILVDKNGDLLSSHNNLRNNIRTSINRRTIQYIIREEEMSTKFNKSLKGYLNE